MKYNYSQKSLSIYENIPFKSLFEEQFTPSESCTKHGKSTECL